MQSAKLGRFCGADSIQYRAHRHEEQRFVDDVTERVRGCAVDRQVRANTHANDHKAQLIIEAESQYAAKIILDDGKHDREQRHRAANVNQFLRSRETTSQCIDRQFGRESTEENGAGNGSFRIGVL